ncbi:zinc ribbon domain-containing protein [Rhodopirellula sallentina]|nr:hypothetical protein [Rhodopirellula sallentina]
MVQCPQCKTAVGVPDDAGGSRVNCPHCGQAFIVPGFAGGTGYTTGSSGGSSGGGPAGTQNDDDDDDWLKLASPTPKPSSKSSAPKAADPPVDAGNSNDASDDDWDLDLPELQPATPRKPAMDAALPDDPLFDDAAETDESVWSEAEPAADDDIASTFEERAPGTNSDGDEILYKKEYRVRCNNCGTLTTVTAQQAGKQVRCRDCHSMVRVPQPPRVERKAKIDMEAAPAFQFAQSTSTVENRPDDPFRKSASELLAAASKVEKDEPKPDLDVPRIRDWAASVFGIFLQIGVVAHWLILSTMASVIAFVALAIDSPMLVVGLFTAGGFFAAVVLACGFTIMQSVANEEESVTEWPVTLEPAEWIAPLIFCFAAAGLSYGPGWFLGYVTFGNGLTTICLSMISTFLIFPFVLLSMLDMQNVFVPFSPDVGRSVTRCEEAWGGFYFSSGIVFFATFLIFACASLLAPPAAAVLGIFTAVFAVFVYFAMLGRLASSVGQSVNADAKENDIAEQREREREAKKNQ